MNARSEWKKIQAVLGTTQDGVPGPHDEEALTRLRLHAKLDTEKWELKPWSAWDEQHGSTAEGQWHVHPPA